MKKLLAIILALAMIICMSATAFADEEETFTLTITGAAGHTYDVYQIFTGTVSKEDDGTSVLSNVKYGENYGTEGQAVTQGELANIVNAADPVALLKNAVVDKSIPLKNDLTPANNESSIVIADLPAGYYMIVDVSPSVPTGETLSPTMLQVIESVSINSKHATIYSEKKVYDTNDSNPNAADSGWADSADHDIGDDVPFMLSVTLPSNFNSYANRDGGYHLTFHDIQAPGFDAPANVNVYIVDKNGGNKIPIPDILQTEGVNGYLLHNTCIKSDTCEFGGCDFTIEVNNLNVFYNQRPFANGDKLVVEYTSKLNTNANVGNAGNENSMYVCHPDGHTVIDTVTVLTYELKINKIDGTSKEALEGAGFTLYKGYPTETEGEYDWRVVGKEIKGDGITSFAWSGLDGGKYKLSETTTPTGYNTIADIEFTIDANHLAHWTPEANHAFEDLIAHGATDDIVVFRDMDAQGNEDGKLEGSVENHKGVVLPETGAEGTMMLIACGTILVILASVFMVVRKKMSIFED